MLTVQTVTTIYWAVGLVILAGCGGPSLRARSAGDMHCPAESLLIHRLDALTYRVNGCGREVVYTSVCDARRECTWIVNSTLHDMEPSIQSTDAGCNDDGQCKGERICVERECVDSAPAPAAPQHVDGT
jgi:hypothetical protein